MANPPPPSEEQVEAARAWIERNCGGVIIIGGVTLDRLATLLAEREAAAYRRGVELMRAMAEAVADNHECGGADDIVCGHPNCGTIIAAGIRELDPQ